MIALANPARPFSPAQRQVLEALAEPVLGGSGSAAEIRDATNLSSSTR